MAILTMAVLAANVGVPAAAAGAALFVVSDAVLALNRFVRPIPRGDVAVHVTYHLAQGLLVLSLRALTDAPRGARVRSHRSRRGVSRTTGASVRVRLSS